MARALYVMSMEPESGKSIVSLGLMELLSRHVDRVGYFRPVVRASDTPDVSIELMRSQYHLAQTYEESFGVTTAQTRHVVGAADAEAIIATILGKFEEVSRQCEIVLVDGSDYQGASAAFEFEMNVSMAANLAAPVVVVSRAYDHRPDQISGALHAAHGALQDHDVPVVGYVINRVDSEKLADLKSEVADLGAPAWFLPEVPTMLLPTVGQVCDYLGAELLLGDQQNLERTVGAVLVAAMTVPNLLGRLVNDSLLIVPADRSDVLMAALAAKYSMAAPRVAGLVLTGGFDPDPHVFDFVKGFAGPQTPVMQVQGDTYDTVARLEDLRPEIEARDERKISLALGLFEAHVDTTELAKLVQVTESNVVTPLMFGNRLLRQARSAKQHVVLPEGDDDRILTAADRLLQREVCDLTILGRPDRIHDRAKSLGLHLEGANLIDPNTSPLREQFTEELYELRKHKGMTRDMAHDYAADVCIFGTMLVHNGLVGGMVSGANHTTADTIRPALQIIKTVPGVSVVSSVFFMCLADRVLVYGDCAVNPTPNPEQLADIAISSAGTAKAFGIEPRIAMLSYSTGASGHGGDVDAVRAATEIVRRRAPELLVEGPIQYDAAVDASVAVTKLPDSLVAGHANVFIFPDLNTGNNTYKAVQRSAKAVAIGPVLQGLRKPINDLSRGATVPDIINTVVITAIQCQSTAGTTE